MKRSLVFLPTLAASLAWAFPAQESNTALTARSLHGLDRLSDVVLVGRGLDRLDGADGGQLRLQKRVKSPSPDAPTDKFVNNQLTNPIPGLPKQEPLKDQEQRIAQAKKTPLTGQVQDTKNPKVIQDFGTESAKNTMEAMRHGAQLQQPHDVRSKAETTSKKRTDRGEAFDNSPTKRMREDRGKIEQGRPADDKTTFTDEKKYHSWQSKPGEKITNNQVSAQEQMKIESGPVKKTNNEARDRNVPAEQRMKGIPQDVKMSDAWRHNMPARMEDTPERQRTPESPVSPGKTPPPINTRSPLAGSRGSSPEPPTKKQKTNSGGSSPTSSPSPSPKQQPPSGGAGTKRKAPGKRDLGALRRRHVRTALRQRVLETLDSAVLAY